jgi:ABC-type multidrug transport system ATPase subunit
METFVNSNIKAIMGPSGSGKTSLLNVLSGKGTFTSLFKLNYVAFYGKTGGKLTINGEQVPIQTYKKEVGFVPQVSLLKISL